jgi:hypothetical protein
LLADFRGETVKDVEALVTLIVDASRLFAVNPWITEMEFNPVAVLAEGDGAVVLDVMMSCS